MSADSLGSEQAAWHRRIVARLRPVIDPDKENRASRAFELGMQAFILLSVVSFSLETLPNFSIRWQRLLYGVEVLVVAIFTVEYALRFLVARNKLQFVFSFFGLIDLLAIAPFYLSLACDLRFLRIIRWFRVFRALKLLRYNDSLQHFFDAVSIVKEQLMLYFMATGLLVYFAAVGIYAFEHNAQPEQFESIFHSLWWAIVTLTSVGYGDVYPITVGGRIFTGCLLPIGLGVITIPAGLLAYGLNAVKKSKQQEERPLNPSCPLCLYEALMAAEASRGSRPGGQPAERDLVEVVS